MSIFACSEEKTRQVVYFGACDDARRSYLEELATVEWCAEERDEQWIMEQMPDDAVAFRILTVVKRNTTWPNGFNVQQTEWLASKKIFFVNGKVVRRGGAFISAIISSSKALRLMVRTRCKAVVQCRDGSLIPYRDEFASIQIAS